jgi:hypothetical protein
VSARTRGVVPYAVMPVVLVLAGCSSTPEIRSYDLDDTDRAACEAFVADLPSQLAERSRVDVKPDDALGAAYGDPAITLTCGVPVSDAFNQTSRCVEVNGVGWFLPDGEPGTDRGDLRVSVPGYRPVVEVVVPEDYRPADRTVGDDTTAAVLSQLSPLVEEHLVLDQRCTLT